jgi:ubiquinone/menaquinone biosynthesis C-methylase UbiE
MNNSTSNQIVAETYSVNDEKTQREYVQGRRAAQWVPFFLPHLKPGMRLLDCGCGVGTITTDLAKLVAPGQVVGLDRDPSQVALAQSLAGERKITNVKFEVGNVYELEFPDASFDAVLAHTLLIHLSDPLRALQELRRVLKPGGVIGVSDDDFGTMIISPSNPGLEQLKDLWARFISHNGGNPYYSRQLRSLLLAAGFAKTEGHAVAADYYGTLAGTCWIAEIARQLLSAPPFVEIALGQGWTTKQQLESIIGELKVWGERPDAFFATMYCAAVGWVSNES